MECIISQCSVPFTHCKIQSTMLFLLFYFFLGFKRFHQFNIASSLQGSCQRFPDGSVSLFLMNDSKTTDGEERRENRERGLLPLLNN